MRALITTDTIGGVWTFTQELVVQLLKRGWAIRLVSLGGQPSASQQQWCTQVRAAYSSLFRYDALEVPLEWMRGNERAWQGAAPQLMTLAHEFGAKILHANQFCFGALPLQIPVVVTAHSDVLSWAAACGKTLEDSSWLRTYCGLVQRGLDHAAAVVAPTQWMARSLEENFVLRNSVRVVSNGRTLPASGPLRRALQAVTAGRLWDEAKNIALLAEVESPFPILVAGTASLDGSSEVSVPSWLKMLGTLDPDQLHALFRGSALYICPSVYEPFGLAPLEAALCGCALLLNDISSLREVWQEGALYFQGAAELSALLRRLAHNPDELAQAQGDAARRAESLTASRMGDEYQALFHDLIAHTGKRRDSYGTKPAPGLSGTFAAVGLEQR